MPLEQEPQQQNRKLESISFRLWLLILLTGVGAGIFGGLLMKLLRLAQHLCYQYSQGNFLSGVKGVSGPHRVLVMIAAGLLAGVVLWLSHRTFGRTPPNLAKAVREGKGDLPQDVTLMSTLLSIVVVGMGAAIGREAALKQAGGLVGAKLAEWTELTPEDRQLLVACGVGAGMAAAYNVPFGGALFTVEVLLRNVCLATVLPAFATSFIATAVSWLLLPNEATYKVPALFVSHSLLVWAVLAGPLLGYASVWFVRGIHWGKEHKPQKLEILLAPIWALAALGALAIPFPQLLGNGKDVVQLALNEKAGIALLCWLVVLRPVATFCVLRAGIPGGLFTPTCAFGSLLGAVLGQAWSYLAPSTDKRSYAVLGVAGVLAASTQAPISTLAFVLELTRTTEPLLVPMMIVIAEASLIYRRFESKTTY